MQDNLSRAIGNRLHSAGLQLPTPSGDRMADRDVFDTATRIAAGDDGTNYDNVAIALHWATAVLVVIQFVLAITWDYFSRGTRENLQGGHVSLGVLLTAVVIARIVWRLIPG